MLWLTWVRYVRLVELPCQPHPRRLAAVRSFRVRALTRLRTLSPETGDALLYALSAAFALVTICTSTLALYRQWAELAIGPFIFGTVASAILAVVVARRSRLAAARPPPPHRRARGATGSSASPSRCVSSPAPRRSRSGSRSSGAPTAIPAPTTSPRSASSSAPGRHWQGQGPLPRGDELHGQGGPPRPRPICRQLVRALPAHHDRVRHTEREEARRRAHRCPDLLQPGHACWWPARRCCSAPPTVAARCAPCR